MKYFTLDWCSGKLSDKETNRVYENYSKYINNIYKELPFTIKILAKNINLHDGIINEIIFYSQNHELIIKCICGDLSLGYYNITLKYLNVSNLNGDKIKECFNGKQIEILYNEIELFENKYYSHRILFNKVGEIEILFNNLELKLANDIHDNYKKNNCLVKISD
jgi:hypothetical protein